MESICLQCFGFLKLLAALLLFCPCVSNFLVQCGCGVMVVDEVICL